MNASVFGNVTATACPTWCVGGHDPVDDFHKSTMDEWDSPATGAAGVPRPTKIYVERHINEEGLQGPDVVVIEVDLSVCEGLVELTRPDVERLVTVLTDLLEVIR